MRGRLLLFLALLTVLTSYSARSEVLGETPFCYRDGLVWLKVSVPTAREPLNFLLDTGASASAISLPAARRLGLRFGNSQAVEGVETCSTAYCVSGLDARIAGIALPRELLAVDLQAISKCCHQPIDGLLGADFFEGRVIQIDFSSCTVRWLAHDDRAVPARQMLRVRRYNDAICVPVSVAGAAPQWARLDTGCKEALEWAVPANPRAPVRGGNVSIGLAGCHSRYVDTSVQLGTEKFAAVRTGLHSQPIFPDEAGLLGNGLLSKFAITVDLGRSCVVLERTGT